MFNGGFLGTNAFNSLTFRYTAPKITNKNINEVARWLNKYDADTELMVAQNIICNRFLWSGECIKHLPLGYIERVLFWNGFAIAFVDDANGLMILPGSITGRNYFNEPVQFQVVGNNYSKSLNIDECVLIRDNYLIFPNVYLIYRYCQMISDLSRTGEIYGRGMKKPFIIATNDKKQMSAENLARNIQDNEGYILWNVGDDLKDPELTKPLFHNTPHNSADLNGLIMAKKTLYSEMLSKVGISTNLLNKGTYRSTYEQTEDNTFIDIILSNATECREKAAEELNELVKKELNCDGDIVCTNNLHKNMEEKIDLQNSIDNIDRETEGK